MDNFYKLEDALCGCCSANIRTDSNLVHCSGWLKKRNLPGDIVITSKIDEDTGVIENVYITDIIFNKPVTIVFWSDGTKTVTKCVGDDKYSPDAGVMWCVAKKMMGATAIHDLLEAWVPMGDYSGMVKRTLTDVRRDTKKKNKK